MVSVRGENIQFLLLWQTVTKLDNSACVEFVFHHQNQTLLPILKWMFTARLNLSQIYVFHVHPNVIYTPVYLLDRA